MFYKEVEKMEFYYRELECYPYLLSVVKIAVLKLNEGPPLNVL
jgi:hypothetical protein